MFTASPRFVINEQAGTGHNMSLSLNARGVPPARCCRSSRNALPRSGTHRKQWRRVDARRIHRTGQSGRPHGAPDRRRRIRDDAVGAQRRQPRTVRRHRREDRGFARRTGGRQRSGLPVRGRRRRRARGALRRDRRAGRSGVRRHRRHPQHRAPRHVPGDRREGCRAGRFGDRRAGERRRRPPSRRASCWSWSAARRMSPNAAARCSRPTPTRSSTSARWAAGRSPRS